MVYLLLNEMSVFFHTSLEFLQNQSLEHVKSCGLPKIIRNCIMCIIILLHWSCALSVTLFPWWGRHKCISSLWHLCYCLHYPNKSVMRFAILYYPIIHKLLFFLNNQKSRTHPKTQMLETVLPKKKMFTDEQTHWQIDNNCFCSAFVYFWK